jgi:Tol biopolymer transport system component
MSLADASTAAAISTDAGADDGIRGISWSPDGRIVYVSEASGNPDIWIMNADGSRRMQLTSTQGQDVAPRVTSDGKYIVFVSDRDGVMRAWRMGLDGSGGMRLSADQIVRAEVSVSADSKWVYYGEPTRTDSHKVSIDGGTSLPLFSADDLKALPESPPPGFHEPMPSPDGALLAGHYPEDTVGSERIVLIPTKGGPLKKLPTVPVSATWAPDGRSLIYIDSRVGVSNLMRHQIAGGSATPLTKFTSDQIFNYALSPDQRQAAIVRGRVSSDVVLISSGPTASAPTR